MIDISSFSCLYSIANLTRQDGEEFLALAPNIPIKTEVHIYPLTRVNEALDDLRHRRFTGAAVIQVETAAAPIHT